MNHKKFIVASVWILIMVWSGASLGAQALASLLPKSLPEGWGLIEGPRVYTKKTLFEHIDGQAELFFKYGYQSSLFASYQDAKNPEDQIELDIYDMGTALQAFGIFSRFRSEDRPGGFGLDSFFDDRSAFFYKGKTFVMLFAAEPNPSILKRFSEEISLRISDSSPPPREILYFPKNGLKAGSIQYFQDGLLGHQFLKRGFQGTYIEKIEAEDRDSKSEGKECRLFLAIFKDSEDAKRGLRTYRDTLSKKGKIDLQAPGRFGSNTLRGEDPYQGQVIIVHKGPYLLGIVGFKRGREAENRLMEFFGKIK
jgi:hypothetical protein